MNNPPSTVRAQAPGSTWKWRAGACAAILLVAAAASWISRQQAERSCQARMGGISAALAGHARLAMGSARSSLDALVEYAQAPGGPQAFHDRLSSKVAHDFLRARVGVNASIDVASFIDASGSILSISRTFPAPIIDVSTRDYFKAHLQKSSSDAILSTPVLGKINQRWAIYLTRRIDDAQGSLLGLALIGVSLDSFSAFYQTLGSEMGEGFSVSLYRDDMMLLARWPRRDDLIGSLNPSSAAGLSIKTKRLDHAEIFVDSPRFTEGQQRQRRLAAPRKVPGEPLIVAPVLAEERCLEAWRSACAGLFLLAIVACVGVLAWRRPHGAPGFRPPP